MKIVEAASKYDLLVKELYLFLDQQSFIYTRKPSFVLPDQMELEIESVFHSRRIKKEKDLERIMQEQIEREKRIRERERMSEEDEMLYLIPIRSSRKRLDIEELKTFRVPAEGYNQSDESNIAYLTKMIDEIDRGYGPFGFYEPDPPYADYENEVMNALARGDGDKYGFGD